jgi:hypothetical protein
MVTEKEMKDIFQNEIPLKKLVLDGGIWEFHIRGNKSIGVSYEHTGLDTHCVGYIFNLFIEDEYINISESYDDIYDAVHVVTEEWNNWE